MSRGDSASSGGAAATRSGSSEDSTGHQPREAPRFAISHSSSGARPPTGAAYIREPSRADTASSPGTSGISTGTSSLTGWARRTDPGGREHGVVRPLVVQDPVELGIGGAVAVRRLVRIANDRLDGGGEHPPGRGESRRRNSSTSGEIPPSCANSPVLTCPGSSPRPATATTGSGSSPPPPTRTTARPPPCTTTPGSPLPRDAILGFGGVGPADAPVQRGSAGVPSSQSVSHSRIVLSRAADST